MRGCILFLTKSINSGFDVVYTSNLLLISRKNKTNQNTITYPVQTPSITFNDQPQTLSQTQVQQQTINTSPLTEFKSII